MRPLEFSEFIKSGGSAKCLTFRVDGEDAASWKHSASPGEPACFLYAWYGEARW